MNSDGRKEWMDGGWWLDRWIGYMDGKKEDGWGWMGEWWMMVEYIDWWMMNE